MCFTWQGSYYEVSTYFDSCGGAVPAACAFSGCRVLDRPRNAPAPPWLLPEALSGTWKCPAYPQAIFRNGSYFNQFPGLALDMSGTPKGIGNAALRTGRRHSLGDVERVEHALGNGGLNEA